MTFDDPLASRIVVEWDWVVTDSYSKLHAPEVWDDPEYDAHDEHGQTVCGYRGLLLIPGLFSRMGLQRCKHCCRMTGMPPGKGSPKNDDACRPIAEQRVNAIRKEKQNCPLPAGHPNRTRPGH